MTASVRLRPMTSDEFETWTRGEVESYALELVEASGLTLAEARRQSAEQTAALLPQGLATSGVHLLRILDEAGEPVGMLWLGRHPRRAAAGWIYDVVIDERRRGQGFGRAAMVAAEHLAQEEGWEALGLNVFGRNAIARRLYESLGYGIDSTVMTKALTA